MSSVPPCPPSSGPGLPRWACSRAEQVFAGQAASVRLGVWLPEASKTLTGQVAVCIGLAQSSQ